MADCSKTVDFIRELSRLCRYYDGCSNGCPLWENQAECMGSPPHGMNEKTISIVQRWSDEHPVMTWIGKLKELLPNAKIEYVINTLCPREIFGAIAQDADTTCNYSCGECWAGEYKEE